MKAAVYRGPGKLAVEDVPTPACPADGVLLRVEACGVCGSDLRTYTSGIRFDREWQILGHEIAGVVTEVGANVSDYTVGDRLAIAADVHCHACHYCRNALYNLCENWKVIGGHFPGGMAEYFAMDAEILRHGIVHRTPDGLSSVEASVAEPASSVLASHEFVRVRPGELVVILGGGPMGCLHVQVARLRGAQPVLADVAASRLDLARGMGAVALIDSSAADLDAEVKALTHGRGADVVITACPAKQAQTQAVEIVAKRGRVVLFGGLPKKDPMTPLDANRIHYNEISVVGAFSYHPDMHALALDLMSRGDIRAGDIVTSTYPLSGVVDAFEAARSGTQLKVVLEPTKE